VFELRHLRYFIAVAEELNFTRAAERLHTAQPSLSQQIRTLEAYLGIQLLARNKRKVELTPAGLRFLSEARLALAQTERAIIRARQSEDVEQLRLGFTHGLIVALLPQLQPLIRASFPNMQVTARSMAAADLEQALKDEEFDVIFTTAAPKEYDITAHRLFGQSLVAVFPHVHPQAAVSGSISLSALMTEKVVIDMASLPADIRQRLAELRQDPDAANALCAAENFFDALGFILSGQGIGLFESSFLRLIPAGLIAKRLADNDVQVDVFVAHRSGLKSAKRNKLLKISQEINILHS
jgi:LysR family hca operon transcriptional activator